MKTAIFIEDLIVKKVMATDYYEYHPHTVPEFTARCEDIILESFDETEAFKRKIVPINRICSSTKPDLYIAYSEEVEELLGVPIRAILDKAEAIQQKHSRVLHANLWHRVIWVFTGVRDK